MLRAVASRLGSNRASAGYSSARRLGRRSFAMALTAASVISLTFGVLALAQAPISPVRSVHLQEIRRLFRENGLSQATVELDRRGRIELQGAYENEREVDRAFSLAQTVVGVRWVSPVIPERIRVKAWMSCLERLFAGLQCDGSETSAKQHEAVPQLPEAKPAAPPGPPREKHALVVGVGRFGDIRVTPLIYAAIDAAEVYKYLIRPSGGNFSPEAVVLLQDAQATRAAVAEALDQIKAKAGPDDLVLVYFSSHGTPPDKYGGISLLTYDTVLSPREEAWQTSVNKEILGGFLKEVRAKRIIVVLDTCYSNAAYDKVPEFLPAGGKSLGADENEGDGLTQRYMAEHLLGMKGMAHEFSPTPKSPPATPEGWDKILISSSSAAERSWESSILRSSVFTHYFLKGLGENGGNVRSAFEYARPLVTEHVKREKGAKIEQIPQMVATRPDLEISLAAGR